MDRPSLGPPQCQHALWERLGYRVGVIAQEAENRWESPYWWLCPFFLPINHGGLIYPNLGRYLILGQASREAHTLDVLAKGLGCF